jgi:predicted nuclease with TOPRIM domain
MGLKEVMEAEKALADFLEANPHLQPLQDEIETRLEKVSSPKTRLAILTQLIGDRVQTFSKAMDELSDETKKLDKLMKALK